MLFNYLLARQAADGVFVLRIDDTDPERSKLEYEEDIKKQLKWLGFSWDEGPEKGGDYKPYRQSEKFDRYRAAAEKLLAEDKAFLDPDGTIRLNYPSEPVVVDDIISGVSEFKPDSLGPEPVILRADKTPTYHLASTVDDIDMEITHVIRGQDHLTNTAKHVIIFNALGAKVPKFAHLPLLLGADGSKLSKRNAGGFVSVKDYVPEGILPEALLNFLLMLGWAPDDDREIFSLAEMIEHFDIKRVRATPAKYELDKLRWFNGLWIRKLTPEDLASRSICFTAEYQELIQGKGEAYWVDASKAMQESYSTLKDAETFAAILVSETLELTENAKSFMSENPDSEKVLSSWRDILKGAIIEEGRDSLTAEEFNKLSKQVSKATGVKGKVLFKSLRIAVMHDTSGPELKLIAPFIEKRLLEQRVTSVCS